MSSYLVSGTQYPITAGPGVAKWIGHCFFASSRKHDSFEFTIDLSPNAKNEPRIVLNVKLKLIITTIHLGINTDLSGLRFEAAAKPATGNETWVVPVHGVYYFSTREGCYITPIN